MLAGGSVLFTSSGWKSYHSEHASHRAAQPSYSDLEAMALNSMQVKPSKDANLRRWWLNEVGRPRFNFQFHEFCAHAPLRRVEAVGKLIWSSVFLRVRNLEKYMQRRLSTASQYKSYHGHVEYLKVLITAAKHLDRVVNNRKLTHKVT
jgi:hypothetical protein